MCLDEPSKTTLKTLTNLNEIDPFRIYTIGFDQQYILRLPSRENRL
jgi:hypothetical protein